MIALGSIAGFSPTRAGFGFRKGTRVRIGEWGVRRSTRTPSRWDSVALLRAGALDAASLAWTWTPTALFSRLSLGAAR